MKPVTRRVFLKQALSGVGAVMLAKSLGPSVSLAQQPPAEMSRAVVAEHTEATDGVRVINAANVQAMMDESVKQLTGEASVADAWLSLLPDFKEEHIVAIKVNCINAMLPTHFQVVDTIVAGLTGAGVPENNIIIYDLTSQHLTGSRYKTNTSDVGVRCFATQNNLEGWKVDWKKPVEVAGVRVYLSGILTGCDHLINVPVLKWHEQGTIPTLSLKNHYGSISSPSSLHGNITSAIPALNSLEAIKDKTRLVVIDALFGCWRNNVSSANFAPNSLIVTKDPVAANHIGAEIMMEERVKNKQWVPKTIVTTEKAAEMGLGTCDPERIELLKVEMGQPKEEEEEPEEDDGKAVEPTHSYKTQWGHIKTAH